MTAIGKRERFMFWLDLGKDNEFYLAEMIADLKSTRRFTSSIRDGLRLICDLRNGNLDVLFELFPWVRAEFLEYMVSIQPQNNDTEAIISDRLLRIETMLSTNGNGSHVLSGVGGLKAMNVPLIPAPAIDEDDDLELTITKADTDGKAAADNFLASAFALQDG